MSARVATTSNITLDNTTTVVDGVTLANGDLVLVKNQTTGTQNGLYVVSTSGAWARSSLLPTGANAYLLIYYVTSGTVNAKINFKCVITPAVVGTDSLVFMPFDTVFLNNLSATTAPTATDDNTKGYSVGSIWINTSTNMPYTCTNSGTGVAVWSQGGTGDVVGPSSATDNAITRFDGTTGKLVQNSTVTISDVAVVEGVKTLTMTDSTTNTISITPSASTTTYALTLPAAQGAANTFLQNNGSGVLSWTAAVTGPASATDTALALFSGTTGKIIQNSVVTLSSLGVVAGVKTLTMTDSTTNTISITPSASTTTYALTLPSAQGGAGSVLTNNGSGTLSWGTTIATATKLSGTTINTVPYQSASATTSYYTYNELNDVLTGASATQTIFVSNLNGSDTYNGLSPQTSVATLGKALTLVTSGGIIKVNRSGTPYSESVSIIAQNITIMSDAYNGSVSFSGTITVAVTASNVSMKGLSIATLVHSGAGALYMFNCYVTTAFSTTSSGFLLAYDCDFQGNGTVTTSVTGSGPKIFSTNCFLGAVTNNNASATVGIYNINNSLIVTVTAGVVSINNSVLYSASAGANALSVASGGVAFLQNVNFTIAGTANPALINIASGAFYSEFGTIRSASSTISGTNLSRLQYFDNTSVLTSVLRGSTSGALTLKTAAATTSYTVTLPAAQGAVNTILQNDGSGNLSWATGGGDVVGPASATNNAIARFDTTTGKLIKNSTVTISDTADIAAAKTLAMDGSTSGTLTIRPAATTTSYTMTMPGAQGTANTYLLNDGSGGLSWAQGTSGNLLNVQTFISATGSFTYTPTLGTNRALVYVVGGGGAGGGAASGINKSCGAGGAGGGCQVGLFAIDTALTGTVVIGAGGTGVSGTTGNTGSNSTFTFNGSTITGTGGTGGSTAQSANLAFLTPPNLAAGTNTTINTILLNSYTVYGSLGARGEVYSATNTLYTGAGGNSAMGGGANTAGAAGVAGGANGVAGQNGVGGGGSGAYQTNGTAFTGGVGGFGGVYVFEYTNNTVTTLLTTEYLMGNLSATETTNITDGNHAPFNQAFQSSNGSTNTGNISLDTTSAYSSGTNTASIGRITLKVGSTYSLMGIIKSLGDVTYYGYSWFNSDTNVRIGTRGESFSATAQMANAASNPSYSTYTPSVDTRVELRLTESATGTIVNWYNGSGGFGETMFNISVVKVTNGQTVFGGSTTVSAGTQGLVPAPAAGQKNQFLRGDATWQIAGLRGLQTISASGTYTPTAGTTRALVYVTGGGGAGGGAASGVINSVGSGGNAGGTYVGLFAIDDTKTGTITIGTGGVGASGTTGGDGTSTSFLFPSTGTPNATITGNVGRGGGFKPTGTTDDYVINPNTNLSGGTATAVNAVLLGGYAITGMSGTQGFMISTDVGVSGNGGSSIYGGGSVGNTRNQTSGTNSGRNAAGFGSGGSGGLQTNNAAASGGNGDGGLVVIYEY